MEEDDFSDHETVCLLTLVLLSYYYLFFMCIPAFNSCCCFLQGQIDDHGVFKTLAKLWVHHAHLAVFMNFVMSTCDPASLVNKQ